MKFNDTLQERIKMFSSDKFIQRIKEEDDRMLKYLEILKKINDYGIITLESQAGVQLKHVNTIYDEKAYILGFMEESKVVKFMNHLSLNTDKNCLVVHVVDDNFDIRY